VSGGGTVAHPSPEAVIGAALDEWDSQLEMALFGTADPGAIAELLDAFCLTHLGQRLLSVEFYRRGVGAVAGLRLADVSTAVVKVHRRELVGNRLEGIGRVQRFLAERGLPAPRPLVPPAPLGRGVATAEEMLGRGYAANAHEPAIRTVLARGLREFVVSARALQATVHLDPRVAVRPSSRPAVADSARPSVRLHASGGRVDRPAGARRPGPAPSPVGRSRDRPHGLAHREPAGRG
jgi:hypothetical protein